MKKLLVLVMLISGYCYAQEPVFNFNQNKIYKINIAGADNVKTADEVARLIEKNLLCVFSYVDPLTGTGYFIVDNFYKVHEIEKMINNSDGLAYLSFEEIPLTEDLFLEMYMKRGGFEKAEFSNNPPKMIIMGPYNELSKALYKKAVSIWVLKYPENKNMIESYYIEDVRKELPKFIDTGNPKQDSLKYFKAKDKWILENPEKYERLIKYKEDNK